MLKFSFKYYLKCILVSLLFYICGGEILTFGIAEEERTDIALIIVPLFYVAGIFIRLKILKNQLKNYEYIIDNISIFQLSVPAIILFVLTLMLSLADLFINSYSHSFKIISLFDDIKTMLLFLYPGGLTINSFVYVISNWNDLVFYSMMIISVILYIIPPIFYLKRRIKNGVKVLK